MYSYTVSTSARTAPPLPGLRRAAAPRVYPTMTAEQALRTICDKCHAHVAERHGHGRHKVILLPEAADELRVMVSYGRRSPMNLCEQMFTGFGHILRSPTEGSLLIIKHFIELKTTNRTAVSASTFNADGSYNAGLDFVEYDREQFLRHEAACNTDSTGRILDPFLQLCGPSEFVLHGHTHPDLGVFFSNTDLEGGRARAASGRPVCMFVVDPIRRAMKGVVGRDLEEAEILVCAASLAAPVPLHPKAPTEQELMEMLEACLRRKGAQGKIKMYNRLGKTILRLRMILPF